MKKVLCLVLIATMTLSLAACGKKDNNSQNNNSSNGGKNESVAVEATHFFEPEYYENLPEEVGNSSHQRFVNNSMFFIGSDDNYTKTGLYEYSLDTKSMKTYLEFSTEDNLDPTEEKNNIDLYFAGKDEIVYLIHTYYTDPALNDIDFSTTTEADVYNFFINNWGYDAELAKAELEGEYYKKFRKEDGSLDYAALMKNLSSGDYPTISKYSLVGMSYDGTELFNNPLSILETDPAIYASCYAMDIAIDDNNNIYLLYNYYDENTDDYCISFFDKDGNQKGDYRQQQYIERFFLVPEGDVAIMTYNDAGNNELRLIDSENASIKDEAYFEIKNMGYGSIAFCDDGILSMEGDGLKKHTKATGESELYLKWLDSNILSGSIGIFGMLDNGKIALYTNHFKKDKYIAEIVVLNETDKEKLLNKTQIRVATLYFSTDFEEAVVEFNKQNNDYHIDVVSFNYEGDDYENYTTYLDNFMLSLASDNSIDMIALNDTSAYNHVINFAQKGLLIDLSELIKNDPKIDENDLIDNLIDPLKYEGKLVALPSELLISTIIGKKSDVGDKMGWEPKKATEILKSKGEDANFILYVTKEEMLEKSMNLSYSEFVDVEKGTCDFDNDTFVQALEFSNLFPQEIDWEDENYSANEPERVNKGKILTGYITAADFDTIQNYQTVWNDEATYIGYPSAGNNNGALICYEGLYGITKNCEDPETAWSLISSMIRVPKDKVEYKDEYGTYNYYAFPTKKNLELYLEVVNENYASEYTNYWDSFEITLKPLTEKMKQNYKDLVFSTTAVSGAVPKGVMDIIKEEASSYYSGQKSAKEVAAIVQSRVKIYLSETR